jgi:hypothetical protein
LKVTHPFCLCSEERDDLPCDKRSSFFKMEFRGILSVGIFWRYSGEGYGLLMMYNNFFIFLTLE